MSRLSQEEHSSIHSDMFCFLFHHFFQDSWRRKIHEIFGEYMYRHTDEERHGGGGRRDIPDDSGNAARPQPEHSLQKKKNTSRPHHCGHAVAKGFNKTSPRAWKFRISGRMFVLERFRVLSDSLFSLFRDPVFDLHEIEATG